MKKGFTLVEVIVVIAIVGAVSVLIGTNFFGLIGNADKYEKENLYKYLNEAACVFVDSKDKDIRTRLGCYNKRECFIKASSLYKEGYIDENAGLLREYSKEDLEKFEIKVTWEYKEKKCCVYKEANEVIIKCRQ